MRFENFVTKNPDAENAVKVRITAYNDQDAKKAADLLSANWNHHRIRPIRTPGQERSETKTYYVLLWN